MAKRFKVKRRKDRKIFKKTAQKTAAKNYLAKPMRGGTRF